MRLHLTFALITIIALVLTLRAQNRPQFTFKQVDQLARMRAAAKYVPLPDSLPPQMKKLTPDEDRGIFSKETARLWRKKGLPFQVDLYHQLNSNPVPHISPRLYTVDAKTVTQLPYSPKLFRFLNFGTKPPTEILFNPPLPNNVGYAGFYIRYPDMAIGSNPNSLDGFFSALGADYFRVIAKDQVYGLSARGIAINPGYDNRPEEFPDFTDWWLQEPTSAATELVLYALLDGPSVAGAYEFRIRPGAVTSVDVHESLYFRQAVERLGIAPFSSMYLYGENAKDHFGDNAHPEVHDSDGALIDDSSNGWMWHPLSQSDDFGSGAKGYQLQYYTFPEESLKGFGLLQRDRDFQHYEDLTMLYNVRPSAWVTPHDGWGKGDVTLIERPSNDFNTDNVVYFWHPAQPIKAGTHLDLSYTIDFYMNDAQRPPLAYTKQTLVACPAPPEPAPPPPANIPPAPVKANVQTPSAPAKPNPPQKPTTKIPAGPPPPIIPYQAIPVGTIPVQFMIDFVGNGIENIPANKPPELYLNYDPPATYLREQSVQKNSYDNSWRVTFTIIPFKHYVPTELSCRLLRNGQPLTETWTYTWRQ